MCVVWGVPAVAFLTLMSSSLLLLYSEILLSSSLLPLSLLSKVVRKKTKCIFHTEDTSSLNDRNREAKSEVYKLTGYVLRASVVAVGVVVLEVKCNRLLRNH